MFLAVSRLQIRSLDWIAEFDAFPLFRKVGGLPFPPSDPARRTATIRETLRLMREEGRSLIVFADGTLRRPGEPWEVGRAVELTAGCRPGVLVVPVSIVYDISIHQRPEAFLAFGVPIDPDQHRGKGELCREAKRRILALTEESHGSLGQESRWEVLQNCLLDVNERFDMRKAPLKPPH
jgi:1-acyl-sn-glycerol-3-phosphate acyltransferase